MLPPPVNRGIDNFFFNLNNLPIILNDILQANFYQAGSDFFRLLINSTIGVAGFFDVATDFGFERKPNGFGLTLARWGHDNSSYIFIPILGPSTIRDTFGLSVDYYASVYPLINNYNVRYGLLGLQTLNYRARLLRFEKMKEEMSIDEYTFVRNAFFQHRDYQIRNEQEPEDIYVEEDVSASS